MRWPNSAPRSLPSVAPSSVDGGAAWAGLALGLALASAAVYAEMPSAGAGAVVEALDWQPALAWTEPWRAWSAAFVHLSALHLAANLAGAALVAAFGTLAHVPRRTVVAWAISWPLTQWGLLARPDLLAYGGLSGVLHAGTTCVALHLALGARGWRRAIGAATMVVLTAKVVSETPWREALRTPPGWDIAVAPFAHASGLAAAAVAMTIVGLWQRSRRAAAVSSRS